MQNAGGKHGQMSGEVRVLGMQLTPEVFDKFPDRISEVSY
jgi:hypothetical protein